MKKVSKLSLTLASVGVFMIGLAGILQYKAFEIEDNTVAYETVTMSDSYSGKIKEVDNKNKDISDIESGDNTEIGDNFTDIKAEEVIIEEELEDVKTYEEVKEATGAGAGCCRGARCKGNIEKLIDENK